jgi:hypothetical protein
MLGLHGHAHLLLRPLLAAALAAGCLWLLPQSAVGGRLFAALSLSAGTAVTLDEVVRHRLGHGAAALRRHVLDSLGARVPVTRRR